MWLFKYCICTSLWNCLILVGTHLTYTHISMVIDLLLLSRTFLTSISFTYTQYCILQFAAYGAEVLQSRVQVHVMLRSISGIDFSLIFMLAGSNSPKYKLISTYLRGLIIYVCEINGGSGFNRVETPGLV